MTRSPSKSSSDPGKSGENRDARLFYLAAQPFHKPVQRDDVVAVIAQRRRSDGKLELALLSEEVNRFFRNLGIDRSFLFESGKQFAHGPRIEQRAGKAVLANLASFLEDVNVFFAELRIGIRWRCARSMSCERRSAQAIPAGPPPTMTTSAGICGRSMLGEGFAEN